MEATDESRLPGISDIHSLDTVQVLYAITLVPAGLLADRVDRPRLLAGGLATWSILTMVAAKVRFCSPFAGCHNTPVSASLLHLYGCCALLYCHQLVHKLMA